MNPKKYLFEFPAGFNHPALAAPSILPDGTRISIPELPEGKDHDELILEGDILFGELRP